MKDRVVQYPHRYQLVPVAGKTNVYDFVPVPGTITEAGTPLNKATLLKDATATLYGLTGEDATVDRALANITKVAQSVNKSYGNISYTDAISVGQKLTKSIAIGEGKNFGRLVVRSYMNTGVLVEFCRDKMRALMVGREGTGLAGNTNAGTAHSRYGLGCIAESSTVNNGRKLGAFASGNVYTRINEVYIDGSYLKVEFEHDASAGSTSGNLNCDIDWEVW